MGKHQSKPEAMFELQLKERGIDGYEREFRFHPVRKWRVDYAFPEHMLAVEIEGGLWVGGRHNRPSGYIKDAEKYAELAVDGWHLLRIPSDWVYDWSGVEYVERFLSAKENSVVQNESERARV